MVFHKNQKTALQQGVKFKKSMLAMCIMALSAPSFAQDAAAENDANVEEIIVTGVRANLQNAQDIKRNSDTFVDSISADDIGSLPDRSVLEAMQRVPGVSIERFAGKNDPDHFGVEGSGAVIRGMTSTRSEFNGRDSFTANSGRGLSFQDVPPELMGGVDVYKNQTADMIEGGIGGTVSLRTRKPFDSDGRVLAFSGDMTYGDMVEKWTPTYSGLYSDRWESSAGEFGLLLNFADSTLKAASDGIQTDQYEPICLYAGCAAELFGATDPNDPMFYRGSLPGAEAFGAVLLPNGSNLTNKVDDRYRKGYAAAFQWESPDDTLLGTFQFMRSDAELAWNERAFKYQSGYLKNNSAPLTGTEFTFNDLGIFTGGTITMDGTIGTGGGWRSNQADRIPQAADWSGNSLSQFGHQWQTDTRYKSTRTLVDDYSFNMKWTPSDRWEHSLDFQFIDASTEDDDVTVFFGTHAMQTYNIAGKTPTLKVLDPFTAAPKVGETYKGEVMTAERIAELWPYANNANGGAPFFQDPTSYYWRSAMDHYERSQGDSTALRWDSTYQFDGDAGLIKSVKAGVRFAEREQLIKYSQYNWGQLAAPWGPGGAAFLDSPRSADNGLAEQYDVIDWSNFHRGGVATIEGGNKTLHPSYDLVRDHANLGAKLSGVNNEWDPANARDSNNDGVLENVDGYFTRPEIMDVSEKNEAAYIRVDFGSDDTALRFSGNIGLRYVKLTATTSGAVQFPDLLSEYPIPAGAPNIADREAMIAYAEAGDPANGIPPAPGFVDEANPTPAELLAYNTWGKDFGSKVVQWAGHANNYLPQADKDFGTDAFYLLDTESTYDDWLPSLNLKVELTDDLVARYAVSKAIAYPDIGDRRNYTGIGLRGETVQQILYPRLSDEKWEPSRVQSASVLSYQGNTGNPYLQPMESIQHDISLEWYFANVGSLTTTLFSKDLTNFMVNDVYRRDFTNPDTGATMPVAVGGPVNSSAEGKMQGIEFAYQQFYDMLPAPFDGLGLQANYSYIDSDGVPNSLLTPDNPDGSASAADVQFGDTLPLQSQSKNTYNIVAMYDKYDWSLRVAYNWRSKYLQTTQDVITRLPIYTDAAGFMDASIFYNINDNIKIGLQGVNLLNTQTKTYMQVDAAGTQLGRSWFVNDRRYTLLVQAQF